MAGLEALTSLIYHEKQQSGSMLCAQHALNSLLQENYFSAPDLSHIAQNLDTLESSYRDQDNTDERGTSTNMDDTGFFSVQVLEHALSSVWGLNLVRWRSTQMKPYQDRPHTQLAFILNYQQHWFTLRRFGPALSEIDNDPGDGHWFNLNSFLSAPEWVGKLYLSMLLQQAESDGYSVFAVVQANPSAPLALPRTEADQIAATLPEPTGTPNYHSSMSYTTNPASSSSAQTRTSASDAVPGFEDEDYDLQAALQASLTNTDSTPSSPPRITRGSVPLPSSGPPSAPGSGSMTPQSRQQPVWGAPVHPPHPSGDADLDPVTASLERQRVRLQRMREQQEFAQRELWGEMGFGAEGPPRREEDDDDEMLKRAIAESEATAKAEGHGSMSDEEVDDDVSRANPYPSSSHGVGTRVYDDEDAELQAALKASLEAVPADWTPPELSHPPPERPPAQQAPQVAQLQEPYTTVLNGGYPGDMDTEDTESVVSETSVSQPAPATPALDAEELRRKRLARFGA